MAKIVPAEFLTNGDAPRYYNDDSIFSDDVKRTGNKEVHEIVRESWVIHKNGSVVNYYDGTKLVIP